jgi:hypothetical protein
VGDVDLTLGRDPVGRTQRPIIGRVLCSQSGGPEREPALVLVILVALP